MEDFLRSVSEGGRSLVLLDELGSGTDPVEGGALACAILLELAHPQVVTLDYGDLFPIYLQPPAKTVCVTLVFAKRL